MNWIMKSSACCVRCWHVCMWLSGRLHRLAGDSKWSVYFVMVRETLTPLVILSMVVICNSAKVMNYMTGIRTKLVLEIAVHQWWGSNMQPIDDMSAGLICDRKSTPSIWVMLSWLCWCRGCYNSRSRRCPKDSSSSVPIHSSNQFTVLMLCDVICCRQVRGVGGGGSHVPRGSPLMPPASTSTVYELCGFSSC